jgi:uncharacterized membrane protein
MLKKVLNRLKNTKVIIAVVSGVLAILVNLGVIGSDVSDEVLRNLNILLGLGVTLGIFGNPETPLVKKKAE